jgi:hypothetical protein
MLEVVFVMVIFKIIRIGAATLRMEVLWGYLFRMNNIVSAVDKIISLSLSQWY